MPRQTADVVALVLVGVVAAVVIPTACTVLVVTVSHPEQDVSNAAEAIGRIVSVLIAALVGFMAGKRVSED